MSGKLVCLGNALREGDRAGPAALASLRASGAPEGVEVVEGGLAGLALLDVMEGGDPVVFLDSVRGFGAPGEVLVLDPSDVVACAEPFDHAAGLPYLLAVYPRVLAPPLPRVAVVGVEEPAGAASVAEAVRTALEILSEVSDVAAAP